MFVVLPLKEPPREEYLCNYCHLRGKDVILRKGFREGVRNMVG